MPTFIKFLFALILRLVIIFSIIGFLIFLLWGFLYLIFLKGEDSNIIDKNNTVLISKSYHLKSFT